MPRAFELGSARCSSQQLDRLDLSWRRSDTDGEAVAIHRDTLDDAVVQRHSNRVYGVVGGPPHDEATVIGDCEGRNRARGREAVARQCRCRRQGQCCAQPAGRRQGVYADVASDQARA